MAYISVKKANCKNCYKCLKFCDVKSISYIDDRVEVIEDQCVLSAVTASTFVLRRRKRW